MRLRMVRAQAAEDGAGGGGIESQPELSNV
jgi:hypothetical protein